MVVCPGCKREIGTTRPSCIYCGHDVSALRSQSGTDAGLSANSGATSAWAVVIEPDVDREDRDAAALGDALGLSAFETQQLMRRPVPYAVDCRDQAQARALADQIETCGFDAVTYPQSDINEVPPARIVHAVTVLDAHSGLDQSPYRAGAGPRRMILTARGGEQFEVSALELRLVAVGELRIRRRRPGFSLGGAYRAARELQRVLDRPLGEGVTTTDRRMLVDLYWEPPGGAITPLRIASNTTTVAGLGVRNYERTAGIGRLLVWLQRAASSLPVDQAHKFDSQRRGSRSHRFSSNDMQRWDRWSARAWVMTRARQNAGRGSGRMRRVTAATAAPRRPA